MIVVAAALWDAVAIIVIPSRADTLVRLGPRDLTMFAHASELCEVLRYAQDDGG
jgi:hypothetical protein